MPQSKSESGELGHYQMLRRSAALPMRHSRASRCAGHRCFVIRPTCLGWNAPTREQQSPSSPTRRSPGGRSAVGPNP
jgi:hypothetical protein